MNYLKQFSLLLIFCFASLTSCTDSEPTIVDEPTSTTDKVKSIGKKTNSYNFYGTVVDTANVPIKNVVVRLNKSLLLTDENGKFTFNDVILETDSARIEVHKGGLISGEQIITKLEDDNTLSFTMLKSKIPYYPW